MTLTTTRRGFLKTSAGAVLVLGLSPRGVLAAGDDTLVPNPFVRVSEDGTVTVILKHFEMGQGTTTGLSTLVAEEMGVPMEAVRTEWAPSDPSRYNNLFFGPVQGTGGSTAMANSFMQYRQAGAAARAMLIEAAASETGTDAGSLEIAGGMVTGAGEPMPLGRFVARAATLEVPAEPVLKDPSQFVLIGNPEVKRKDTAAKIDGSARFATDLHLDDQLVAVIARSPRMGGTVAAFDHSGAAGIKGFAMAAALPDNSGVAVFAETTWAAIKAREAISVDWNFDGAESRSSDQIRDEALAAVNAPAEYHVAGAPDAADALAGAAQVVERTFTFPLLAHAPMEPMTCTIRPDGDGGVTLIDGCQFPTLPHGALAAILELPMEKVRIETLYAGGSFGRRANPDADYQAEAAKVFVVTDRSRPVKLAWTREDDITGGYFRPAFAHRVRVGLDDGGNILGWDHRIAGQSIIKGTAFEQAFVKDGVDHSSVEGVADTPYAIPGFSVGLTDIAKATTVLWWRSVGHTHTAYVMESMMDDVARAAGRDPLEFRLAHLDRSTVDGRRMAGVLELVAEKAGWGSGGAQGLAVHKSFGTYVAEVIEVTGSPEDGVKIGKVTAAVDCGIAVNPDIVAAQIEGGIGYGLGAVMRNAITLEGGAVVERNFPDYEPLRITDIGAIETHIVTSDEAPSGIGEPGVPPAGPALANAIAALGLRVTDLPMAWNGVTFA